VVHEHLSKGGLGQGLSTEVEATSLG
jgi:hypothetical protein